jgi:hypothetical protein
LPLWRWSLTTLGSFPRQELTLALVRPSTLSGSELRTGG